MGVEHSEKAAVDVEADFEQSPLLAAQRAHQQRVHTVPDRKGGQRGHAVLPTRSTWSHRIEVHVGAIRSVQAQPSGEPRGLITEPAARSPVPVDLLQADDVGPGLVDDRGGALQVEQAVGTDAVVDVERRQPKRSGHSGLLSAGRRLGFRPGGSDDNLCAGRPGVATDRGRTRRIVAVMSGTTGATPNQDGAPRRAPWSAFVVLFLLWIVASVVLLLWAAEPTLTFLGDVATAEELALSESRLTWAFVGSTVLALIGLALGIGGRRPGWAVVFAVALLVVGVVWIAETAQSVAPPADDHPVPVSQ